MVLLAYNLKKGWWRGGRERLEREVYPLTAVMFYGKKENKSKLPTCKVEMSYINWICFNWNVSTGLSTFLPFYEDEREGRKRSNEI